LDTDKQRNLSASNIDEVLFSERESVGEMVLNRPQALNALTQNMVLLMQDQLEKWSNDSRISMILIRGAPRGEKMVPFCSGGDLRSIYEHRNDPNKTFASIFYAQEYRLNSYINKYPKPYMSIIDGIVMGGGVGVSIHGSHRIMSERSVFAMPETGIGLFPDVGGTYFLSRLPGSIGLYIGLTSARLTASDCLNLGIATHFISSNRIDEFTNAINSCDLQQDTTSKLEEIISYHESVPESAPILQYTDQIDRCFSARCVEEIFSNLEKEKSEWAIETIKILQTKSPTSLKLTFRQLTTLGHLNLRDALNMEYRMAVRCNFSKDWFEGIRAVIIDKDFAPEWYPAEIAEVDHELIDEYFKAPRCGDMRFDSS
tara:strand:- start:31612 stop:32724 length:1113 start_codon:yes stop_codon:yes gene_type:complete